MYLLIVNHAKTKGYASPYSCVAPFFQFPTVRRQLTLYFYLKFRSRLQISSITVFILQRGQISVDFQCHLALLATFKYRKHKSILYIYVKFELKVSN